MDSFRYSTQIAHPLDIEWELELGLKIAGLDAPRLERVPAPPDHPAQPYLNSALRDAGVHSVAVGPDEVALTVNDLPGWRLACAYEIHLNRKARRNDFHHPALPVELSFRGLRELLIYRGNGDRSLMKLDRTLEDHLRRIHSFRDCHVLSFEADEIVAIFNLDLYPARFIRLLDGDPGSGAGAVTYAPSVYLCLNAQALYVHGRQRECWISEFGESSVWIWDRFCEVRLTRPMPAWSDAVAFLSELLAVHRG